MDAPALRGERDLQEGDGEREQESSHTAVHGRPERHLHGDMMHALNSVVTAAIPYPISSWRVSGGA
jgi:hypothetical protein